MRRSTSALAFAVGLAAAFMMSSCSRQNPRSESASAQPPRGAAQDPGGGTMSGATATEPPVAPMAFERPAITSISDIVNSTNSEGLSTRMANLSSVTVQERMGDFILVGPDKEHAVPVQISGQHPEIKPGQKVNLSGMINPLGKDKSQWNGNPAVQKDLSSYSIFIQAGSIQLAGGR